MLHREIISSHRAELPVRSRAHRPIRGVSDLAGVAREFQARQKRGCDDRGKAAANCGPVQIPISVKFADRSVAMAAGDFLQFPGRGTNEYPWTGSSSG
jgi:hypothetical protein